MDNETKPIRVLHIITRLIVGGAQENTMLTAGMLNHGSSYNGKYSVEIVSGPQTGPEGSLIQEVKQRGIHLHLLSDLVRELNPMKDFRALLKLRRMMVDSNGRPRYHIVHTHSSKAGVLGRLAAYWAGIPVIVHTIHGWSFHEYMSPLVRFFYTRIEKFAARFGQRMIVVTSKDITKGLEHGIGNPAEYIIIRSGIELHRFVSTSVSPLTIRRQLGIPPDATVIGSVTRFSPQKAPLDMINAFIRIHREHRDAWFVIVGDGPLRPEAERAVQLSGIAQRTIFTGIRRDVPELLAAFDIFVLSSLWEGLPRVLPQAMAAGLPIVCARADGTAEAVNDGENGFTVEPGDYEHLAANVGVLIGDIQLRRDMGENGRKRAAEFSASKMVCDIDLLYGNLLREVIPGAKIYSLDRTGITRENYRNNAAYG